ncbi:hypothetical protein EPI10_024421 [Gossypium australe]|uniref:Uncharacterized protein n=1 Tax=Gossypium australe TaxID=47621 RepID=A0A5B6VXS2_9ROSI|nr:hypothetical protein EPI10_024421 [Gossypium australe]
MKFNPEKYAFGMQASRKGGRGEPIKDPSHHENAPSMNYKGHTVPHRQINPSPERVHAIDNSKSWLVYVNGSTAKIGSGASPLIIDPSGNEWQYKLSLGSKHPTTSSNLKPWY